MLGGQLAVEWSAELQKPDHLAYGIDWKQGSSSTVIATCSFYNHSMQLWRLVL